MIRIIKYLLLLTCSCPLLADLPLGLDKLTLDQKEITFEVGTDYYNAYSTHDTNGYFGIRYGINSETEVYVRADSTDDFTLGLNTQLSPENKTVAVIGFAEVQKNNTAMLGVTAYRSIDPVVLSMTTGYQRTKTTSNNCFIGVANT